MYLNCYYHKPLESYRRLRKTNIRFENPTTSLSLLCDIKQMKTAKIPKYINFCRFFIIYRKFPTLAIGSMVSESMYII